MNELIWGSSASMRASRARVSSTGDSSRRAINWDACAIVRKCRSDTVSVPLTSGQGMHFGKEEIAPAIRLGFDLTALEHELRQLAHRARSQGELGTRIFD